MSLFQPTAIALLVIFEVSLWQLRIVLTNRSYKLAAASVSGIAAIVYVTALGQVLTNLDNPLNIAGYAIGVSVGVFVGSWLGDRLASGQFEVRIVVDGPGIDIVRALRQAGWPLTAMNADGLFGPATVAFVAVDGANVEKVTALVEQFAPRAFWTVEHLSTVQPTALPGEFVQVGARRLRVAHTLHLRHRPSGSGTGPAHPHLLRRKHQPILERKDQPTTGVA